MTPLPSQIPLTPEVLREIRISLGTEMATAQEVCDRLRRKGKGGLERTRNEMAAGILPGIKDGNGYVAHWPSVVKSINEK